MLLVGGQGPIVHSSSPHIRRQYPLVTALKRAVIRRFRLFEARENPLGCIQNKKPHLSIEKQGFRNSPIYMPSYRLVAKLEDGYLFILALDWTELYTIVKVVNRNFIVGEPCY